MRKYIRTFALMSLSGNALYIIAVLLLHFLRKDLYVVEHFVSEYALGNYGWILTIALFSLAIGQLSLLVGLTANIKLSITSLVTFSMWCLCIFLVAIFPTNLPGATPTTANNIHNLSAFIAFTNLPVAMITWGSDFKKDTNWKKLTKTSWTFGTLSFSLLIALILSPILFIGVTQRILTALDLSWLIIVARQLYLNKTNKVVREVQIH